MANPTVISAARFPEQLPYQTQPVYRFPKAHLLTRLHKQGVALHLWLQGVKPRHIRKCLSISNRQLKKAKKRNLNV
jgi:hypothetical protein